MTENKFNLISESSSTLLELELIKTFKGTVLSKKEIEMLSKHTKYISDKKGIILWNHTNQSLKKAVKIMKI